MYVFMYVVCMSTNNKLGGPCLETVNCNLYCKFDANRNHTFGDIYSQILA